MYNQSNTLFSKIDPPLSKIIEDIDIGDIGLPDIQRPFVWKASKVRDLFDSMYKGYPVGHLIFWNNNQGNDTKKIGTGDHQRNIPRYLIVDGQQRLTSLYAVMKGKPVVDDNYQKKHIQIAFNPLEEKFEVADATVERDPEFIPNISKIWVNGYTSHRLVNEYLNRLAESRDIDENLKDRIGHAIDKLFGLQRYPFTGLEISSNADEEEVADIFVRINSKGINLNQADFILTLLSVFWEEGRKQLEEFCHEARQAPKKREGPSPYNNHIEPHPAQLLRVSIALGFKKGRLKSVYQILRGKDPESGEFLEVKREEQFQKLKDAQEKALNLKNWHEFLNILITAGFRSDKMVSSKTALLYSYALYLIGKEQFKIDRHKLRWIIGRWFFMSTITARYSGSPESTMDRDLSNIRGMESEGGFIETLEGVIRTSLTSDFWEITLPNNLITSSSRSPGLFGYYAALNILNAPVLYSTTKVSEMLDPNIIGVREAIEKHHLFPIEYLKDIGIDEVTRYNQVANYALVEWGDNADIKDKPPEEYVPEYEAKFSTSDLEDMYYFHALPERWYEMEYEDFLEERRILMADIIRKGFEKL